MAISNDAKITELDLATALTGVEIVPLVQSSETRRSTVDSVKAYTLINVPKWVIYKVDYAMFTAGATTEEILLFSLAANQYISDVKIVPKVVFLGGAIASYTLSVGVVGTVNKYAGAKSVFTGNTTVTDIHNALAGLESLTVATNIKITATTTVGNLNVATQGEAYIYILISTLL